MVIVFSGESFSQRFYLEEDEALEACYRQQVDQGLVSESGILKLGV